MAEDSLYAIKDIRETLKLESNAFSVYRNRLIQKGFLIGVSYGKLEFVLPCFKEFVMSQDY